jgi:adenosylcobinamide-GDP ribazoletransferase
MRQLILAIQFLTRLPTPQIHDFQEQWLVDSARWFPFVGFIIGLFIAAIGWSSTFVDVWFGAWASVLCWILITGGLHLDGLADVADALGAAHRDKSRLLAVMKDPHLGSFGVLSLIVAVVTKLVLLMLIAKHNAWLGLILIPVWARLGIYDWQRLPSLSEGLAERFTWHIPYKAAAVWLALLTVVSYWLAPVLLLAPLFIVLYRKWLVSTLGGVSGDCLGAGVEVVEMCLLLSMAVSFNFNFI